jgi:hypothetical protein
MINRETIPSSTVVDIEEYEDNFSDRVRVEDMLGSDEIYVFYGRIAKLAGSAIRAYASVDLDSIGPHGIRASGSVTFRDVDFSSARPEYGFSGTFHASFFTPNRSSPIFIKPGPYGWKPVETGFLVRDTEDFDTDLLEDMALPSLDRASDLVSN